MTGYSVCHLLLLLHALLLGVGGVMGAAGGSDTKLMHNLCQVVQQEAARTNFHWVCPTQLEGMDTLRNLKPYMFFFTSSTCGDCRTLLEDLAKEDPTLLGSLSAQIIPVMVLDDFALQYGVEFAPNNHDYIPRIIFADPDGKVRADLVNKRGHADTAYYYSAREMLWMMQRVLAEYRTEFEPFPEDLDYDLPS